MIVLDGGLGKVKYHAIRVEFLLFLWVNDAAVINENIIPEQCFC